MFQVVKMSFEEKKAMYRKMPKDKIIEMLIANQDALDKVLKARDNIVYHENGMEIITRTE